MYEHALHDAALDHSAKRRVVFVSGPSSALNLGQNEDEQLTGSHDLFVLMLLWVVAVSNVFDGEMV